MTVVATQQIDLNYVQVGLGWPFTEKPIIAFLKVFSILFDAFIGINSIY